MSTQPLPTLTAERYLEIDRTTEIRTVDLYNRVEFEA